MYIYEKSGKRRKAVKSICLTCDNEFLVAKREADRGRGKYCSKDCSYNKNLIELVCAQCDITFKRPLSKTVNSKSGLYFCNRECKDKAQRLGGVEEIMPDHYGTAEKRAVKVYRRLYKELNNIEKLSCERCGYNEFECGVDIHHLDGDPLNNIKENLKALCACCHRALHNNCWRIEI